MGSLLLISGCGPASPPAWPPDAGSYVDVIPTLPGTTVVSRSVWEGVKYRYLRVAVEPAETGQEAAIWAFGVGCGQDFIPNTGHCNVDIEHVLYVQPSDSGATVIFVDHMLALTNAASPDYVDTNEEPYYTSYASNATFQRNANLIRGECLATGQEYEMQGEELISLGLTGTVKLRFQLDLEPAPDNVTRSGFLPIAAEVFPWLDNASETYLLHTFNVWPDNATEIIAYAKDRFGPVIQHVLQKIEN